MVRALPTSGRRSLLALGNEKNGWRAGCLLACQYHRRPTSNVCKLMVIIYFFQIRKKKTQLFLHLLEYIEV